MKKWSMCIFVVAVCLLLGTAQASISPLNGTFTLDTQSPMISFDSCAMGEPHWQSNFIHVALCNDRLYNRLFRQWRELQFGRSTVFKRKYQYFL